MHQILYFQVTVSFSNQMIRLQLLAVCTTMCRTDVAMVRIQSAFDYYLFHDLFNNLF